MAAQNLALGFFARGDQAGDGASGDGQAGRRRVDPAPGEDVDRYCPGREGKRKICLLDVIFGAIGERPQDRPVALPSARAEAVAWHRDKGRPIAEAQQVSRRPFGPCAWT